MFCYCACVCVTGSSQSAQNLSVLNYDVVVYDATSGGVIDLLLGRS